MIICHLHFCYTFGSPQGIYKGTQVHTWCQRCGCAQFSRAECCCMASTGRLLVLGTTDTGHWHWHWHTCRMSAMED